MFFCDFLISVCMHNRFCEGIILPYTEFLARKQIWPAQLPPTAFSDQRRSVSKKIKMKRKRMMGWIKNGPKKKSSWFIVCQHLPAKTNSFPFRFIILNLEEPIGYPAHTGLISLSICLSVCPSIHPSICLEYKNTLILNVGIKIRVPTWSFLSVVCPLWIPIPMCKKKIWVQQENS